MVYTSVIASFLVKLNTMNFSVNDVRTLYTKINFKVAYNIYGIRMYVYRQLVDVGLNLSESNVLFFKAFSTVS